MSCKCSLCCSGDAMEWRLTGKRITVSAGAGGGSGSGGAAATGTWLIVSGLPSNATGTDGQFAFDPGTGTIYIKQAGAWSIAGEISGNTQRLVALKIASHPVSALRALYTDGDGNVAYASNDVVQHRDTYLGISINSGNTTEQITVLRTGEIADASWSWTPNLPVFVGVNGALTQTPPIPPAARFGRIVGHALSATRLYIDPREPYTLNA